MHCLFEVILHPVRSFGGRGRKKGFVSTLPGYLQSFVPINGLEAHNVLKPKGERYIFASTLIQKRRKAFELTCLSKLIQNKPGSLLRTFLWDFRAKKGVRKHRK